MSRWPEEKRSSCLRLSAYARPNSRGLGERLFQNRIMKARRLTLHQIIYFWAAVQPDSVTVSELNQADLGHCLVTTLPGRWSSPGID